MRDTDTDPAEPPDEDIALTAYRIWLHDGCPQGKDREHWLKARQILLAERSKEKAVHDPAAGDGARDQAG